MTTFAFDTYKLSKLRSRGFSEEQAAGVNEAIQGIDVGNLASKADLLEVRSDLTAEIDTVRTELGAEIQSVRSEMREMELRIIIRVGSMMFIGFGFLAAIKFFGN